jgi:hypothetical protein
VGAGDLDTVRHLLELGADPNAGQGETLRAAARRGDLALVRLLFERGADLHAHAEAALRAAAAGGHLAVVQYLHANGADLHADGESALREAVAQGHLAVVHYLHQNGADLHAENGEALRVAAAAGRGNVVSYLHVNGVTHSILSETSRAQIHDMNNEIRAAPAIYHPSRFWEFLNRHNFTFLAWGGEHNFKRTINQSYFNAVPTSLLDPKILNLVRLWLRFRNLQPFISEIDDPDCDPCLWPSWYEGYFIFKGKRHFLLRLYKWYVGALYEYGLKTDRHGVLARLEEPELGNPIRIWRQGRLISQDLINSVRERNAIVEALESCRSAAAGRAPLIAELGAGYGRLGHVLLATTGCRYMIFDLPPALHLSQWYLSRLFPDRRIFSFRRFGSYAEIAAELAEVDIAFFTPNQLELFPDRHFDAFATISSLHEMRREQIDHFLRLMAAKTRDVIYMKQQAHYVNPYDGLHIKRSEYVLPPDWQVAMERGDALNPGFFELVASRSDPTANGPAAPLPESQRPTSGGADDPLPFPLCRDMRLNRPDILIFFHIGKTGGTTLGRILARNFPEDWQFNANRGATRSALGLRRLGDIEVAYRALSDDRRRRIHCVSGHVPIGIHELFDRRDHFDPRYQYITLLRHPVDRVISSFYYVRQQEGIPISKVIKDFEIDEYIESRLGLDPYDYQVRVLSGCSILDAEWTDLEPLTAVAVNAAHLERAKRNIERHFLFVGTTERFEEALMLIRRIYGWKFEDVLFLKENVTRRRPQRSDLPVGTIENIRRHNTYDLALYEWADTRFRRLVRSLGVRFQAETHVFKCLNRRFQRRGLTRGLRAVLAVADVKFC